MLSREEQFDLRQFHAASHSRPGRAFARGRGLERGAAAEALSGYAPEEIIGRNLDSIISEPFAAAARTAFAALRGGGSATFETLLRRKDGSLVEIAVDARTQPDGPGPSQFAAVIRDLTQSRRAGRRVEERLRLALGAAEIGTYEIDLMTERFVLDACAAAIWGRDPARFCVTSPSPSRFWTKTGRRSEARWPPPAQRRRRRRRRRGGLCGRVSHPPP